MIPIYLINFLLAVSTTIGMTVIPFLVIDNLGLSLFILGIIEGGTEFISNALRLVTGNMFDRVKNKKMLFVIPTLFAAISKLFLFIPSSFAVLSSKLIERITNGAFAAPRDAYVGVNAVNKGVALGFLSSSKTFGCILGPILVSISCFFIGSLKDNLKYVVAIACLVSISAFILSFFIKTKNKVICVKNENDFNFTELKKITLELKSLWLLIIIFFLGRFNDGVIMLSLKQEGFPEWFYLSTISVFNAAMFVFSPFMGMLIDKKYEKTMLIITILSLLFFNVLFFNIQGVSWYMAIFGLICWGIQRAGAQITFASQIFKQTPKKYYGTAIGIYSLLSGVGVFCASAICGYLAKTNFQYVFVFSGVLATLSLIGCGLMFKSKNI